MPVLSTLGGASKRGFTKYTSNIILPGAVTLTTSGTWTVPEGVTSICVACVGAGGNGIVRTAFGGWWVGGSGGGLTYKNNIAVTPGQVISYTVATGAGTSTTFQSLNAASGSNGFEPGSSGAVNYGGVSSGGDVNYTGGSSNGISGGSSVGGAAATVFGNGATGTGTGTNFGSGIVPYGGGGTSVHSPATATNGQPGAIRIIWGTGKSFPNNVV